MLEDLNGQVAVVTGGARGLGFSMAGALARLGVRVALLDMLPWPRPSTRSAGNLARPPS
jgi:NAD(P)-dependent dehydrogenase (short-subunit alcohol dehydrogenase family)